VDTTGQHRSENPSDGVSGRSDKARSDLPLRVASALVLAPIAVAAAYYGGWAFVLFFLIAATAVLWEWNSIAAPSSVRLMLSVGVGPLLLAAFLAGIGRTVTPTLLIIIGAFGAAVFAPGARREWTASGVLYAGALLLGPIVLRRDPEFGLLAIIYLFAIVWTTDSAAYFIGRAVGGPKLWPRVSPKKTWSGAIGGTLAATALGAAVVAYSTSVALAPVVLVGIVLSVVSQAGDLFESAVKRRFGVKDASNLIPGHGGVMDRLDGFLFAAFAAAALGIAHAGPEQAARGLLDW
jgi:phosphatidate cytidylyltransferase